MKLILKKGDKVKVKRNLIVNQRYGEHFFHSYMKSLLGRNITIRSITKKGDLFLIDEDKGNGLWDLEMVEKDVQQRIE